MIKTIEHIKERIQFYKTSKANYAKECIKHPNNKTFEEAEKLCEELIQINEQIKCELEALKFLKEELDLKIVKHKCDVFHTNYALECDYTGVIPLFDEEFNLCEKVLEVEDE